MTVDAARLQTRLSNQIWRDLLIFESLSSTNDYLKELAQSGAPEGTVVIAKEQTTGRGRLRRSWESPRGGAWLSILLKPPIAPDRAGCIAILLAVVLAEAIRERWGLSVGVKWPNDLYLSKQKLGGILIELSTNATQIEWLIAGIGINVNNELPRETRVPATSLARELGKKISLEEFFGTTLEAIARGYEKFLAEGFAFVRQRWADLSVLGQRVDLSSGTELLEAEVLGLSESGKLIVRTAQGGVREVTSEEVSISL